ncbi:tetratricopeptide repeat protein [Kordia sp. YSTF-M3]|uniref:histidine kinase n=1 Tax=Kordia aestuariivivens TaxID=2759037 RepID=A0ABR7QF20_9FLAO|nr:tetratricopeptide repeat-containing sensor histidine kinase [Kordia aestuariivivens]MBC8757151.1 tetratricopeptide repeat protein [Kordia aestuariivivens]
MKNNTNSFLFFLIIIFFMGSQSLLGQRKNDSIPYYVKKSQNFNNASDLIEAKTFFETELNSIEKDDPYILYFKYNLASIEKNMSNYEEAENLLVSILEEIDLFTDPEYKAQYQKSAFNLLGNIYREQKNKEKAIELFNRAIQRSGSALDSAVIYNNISNIYREFNEVENAKNELVNAYNLFPRFKDTLEKARILDNLGYIYTKLDSTFLGLKLIKRGLRLREEVGINTEMFASYHKLTKYYHDQGNDTISRFYANKVYELSQKIKTPNFEEDALGLQMELHSDPRVRRYKKLNDSLSKIKFNNNNYAIYKYDISELERQVFQEKSNKEQQKSKTLLFAFLGGLILIIAVFLIILQRNRNKRHTLTQIHKTERNLSKKVHDELGNDIFYLMNQIQTNPASLLEKEGLQVLNGLNDIYVKARDISKTYTTIDTNKGYHDELLSLLNSFGNDSTKIVTNEIAIDFWYSVSKLKKEQVYRVLQELLTNMKKHSEASLVGITFTKIKKNIIIKYVDNGKGTTKANTLLKNGLANVENRIAEINGTITFETSPENGFKTEIRFIQ